MKAAAELGFEHGLMLTLKLLGSNDNLFDSIYVLMRITGMIVLFVS